MSRKKKYVPKPTKQLIKEHAIQHALNLPFAIMTGLIVAFIITRVNKPQS